MRTPFVAGNWKMNKTAEQARQLVVELLPGLQSVASVERVLCPPNISIMAIAAMLNGTGIGLGAQNMHWANSGAFTGEISPLMLKELCEYVIIGHSERRAMFGETDETVNKKVLASLAHGLKPIVCVGETLEENQSGITAEVVGRQVRADLQGLTQEQAEQVVIAYEPVWAIGTGLAATPEGANAVHKDVIRPILRELFGEEIGDGMRILYGGSVTPANAEGLFGQSDIDGGLIGGASLKAESFIALVKAAM